MGSPLYESYYNNVDKLSNYLSHLNKASIFLPNKFKELYKYLESSSIKNEVESIIIDYDSKKISIQLSDRLI